MSEEWSASKSAKFSNAFSADLKTVVSLDNIIYLEASNHATLLHTIYGDYYDNRSLKDFLSDLNSADFSQIHKAFAINMDYLLNYSSNSILLVGNIDLTIGRAYKAEFNKQYQEYLIKWQSLTFLLI